MKVGGSQFILQKNMTVGAKWITIASSHERSLVQKMFDDVVKQPKVGGWRIVDQSTGAVLCSTEPLKESKR